MATYVDRTCPKCHKAEAELREIAIPGVKGEGPIKYYDLHVCPKCDYKFIVERETIEA